MFSLLKSPLVKAIAAGAVGAAVYALVKRFGPAAIVSRLP